jgi:predicted metal-dependent phosphotriesterase family hydrolase
MKPEKITEQLCLSYCNTVGIDVDVIDSKATFSQAKNIYTKSKSVPEGFSDLVGNTQDGVAVFIELKAKGKLKTLREKQYMFLRRKIMQNCFACAVDSDDLLHDIYMNWIKADNKIDYLLSRLPKIKSISF